MSDKQKITITVSGRAGSGKSSMIVLLQRLLKEAGIEVQDYDDMVDFVSEDHIIVAKEHLQERVSVNFSEIQIGAHGQFPRSITPPWKVSRG